MARRAALRADLRAELGVDDAELVFMTVANLRPEKGYQVLLDAARAIADRGIPLRIAAVGRGPLDTTLHARHVELALGEPAGRAPDMAGPQVSNWTDLLRGYLKASHRRRWVLPVRIPGTRVVRNGALLPPPGHTVGSRTWDQFLTTQLRQQATTTA